jgi:hypothetical protein
MAVADPCFCSSLAAAESSSSHESAPVSKQHRCCCNMKPGKVCHCGMACCECAAPVKGIPTPRNRSYNENSGTAKVLSLYLLAITASDNTAGLRSGKSPYASTSIDKLSTLQLQHVRLQI